MKPPAATLVLLLSGRSEEVFHAGDGSLLAALDVDGLRAWSMQRSRPLCMSLTFGDGSRAHGVGQLVSGSRVLVLSRRPAFGFLREALSELLRARCALEARAAARKAADSEGMPSVEDDVHVGEALCRLSGDALVVAWAAILLEARICIRAKTKDVLAPLAAGLVASVEPLSYSHVHAPVLPSSAAVDVLSAPVPFLVGVSASDRNAWRSQRSSSGGNQSFSSKDDDDSSEEMVIQATSDDWSDESDDESSTRRRRLQIDENFDDATTRDGIIVIDADSGSPRIPPSFRATLATIGGHRFWDALAREAGRRLREGKKGPASAVRFLQKQTAALLGPRLGKNKTVIQGNLDWTEATTLRSPSSGSSYDTQENGDDAAKLRGSSLNCWAEFDGLALWLYVVKDDPGAMPALWLPLEAIDSVSPLSDRRFELAATNKNVSCFCAANPETKQDPRRKKRRRSFLLTAPSAAEGRTWTASIEGAINKLRSKRRPRTPADTSRALHMADEITHLRDAVMRTQSAHLALRRHFDEHELALRDDDDDKRQKNIFASSSSSSEEEAAAHQKKKQNATVVVVVSKHDDAAAGNKENKNQPVVVQRRRSFDDVIPGIFGRFFASKSGDELDQQQQGEKNLFLIDGRKDTSASNLQLLIGGDDDHPHRDDVDACLFLRLALEGPDEQDRMTFSEADMATTPTYIATPMSTRTFSARRFETASSDDNDTPYREVMLHRPRMISLFPSDDDAAVAASNALNAAAWPKDKNDDDANDALRRLVAGKGDNTDTASSGDKTAALLDSPSTAAAVTPTAMRRYRTRRTTTQTKKRRQQRARQDMGRSPSISPNDVVVALLDRLVALVRLQSDSSIISSSKEQPNNFHSESSFSPAAARGTEALDSWLEGVRSTTGFEAFEEASALLWRISLDSLAYDTDAYESSQRGLLESADDTPSSTMMTTMQESFGGDDDEDTTPTTPGSETLFADDDETEEDADAEAARIAFFVNVHNLAVLHACIARGAPPVSRGASGVVRYYAWSRSQKYAVGGLLLSIFQIEHSILRAPDNPRTGRPAGSTWTGWLSDLARFAKNDPRRMLVPRSQTQPELSFALFAATRSSAPLAIFRANTRAGLDAELKAHAASVLAKDLKIIRKGLFENNDNRGDHHLLSTPASHTSPLLANTTSPLLATPESASSDAALRRKSSSSSNYNTTAVVLLPAAMRWHQRCWGRSNADIVAAVHRLLADHGNDFRLAHIVDDDDDDDDIDYRHERATTPWPKANNKRRPVLKVEYQSYDWSPGLSLAVS